MESEPESKEEKEEEEEDADDGEDGDDKDYDGGDEDHEKEKGETKEANQSTWKTRLLPEGTAQNWHGICLVKCWWHCFGYISLLIKQFYLADFKELFTTRASNSEEDSGLHTLGTIPSLPDEQEGTYHPSKGS